MTNCGLLMSGTIHTRVKVCKIDLLDDLGFSVKDKSSKLNLFSFFRSIFFFEFLTSLKKEFGGEEEELVKVVELRKLEQRGKTMEEFV